MRALCLGSGTLLSVAVTLAVPPALARETPVAEPASDLGGAPVVEPKARELQTARVRLELTPPSYEHLGYQQKAGNPSTFELALSPADPSGATPAAEGTSQPIDLGIVPIDYNEPDPNRGVTNHFRALGGVTFANYVNWQFAWLFMDMAFVTRHTIARNLRIGFIWDDNKLSTNFFRHPYQGSMYYHAARGAGLSLWEASLYTAFGSLQWEFMGETHPAAPNDFYTTTLGGVAMGEMLYRLSSEILDDSTSGWERFWREMGGAALAPMRGFQRLTSGDAWAEGPPHKSASQLDVEFNFGIEHVRSSDFGDFSEYDPSFLLALKLDYGDQLPKAGESSFEPYEFFDSYISGSLFNSDLSGGRLFINGVLAGWNQWLSEPDSPHPDNNIIGFLQSFEYANANALELGATGLGVADWINFRFSDRTGFRLSAAVEWQAMSGATSPFTQATGRSYNFGMGMSGTVRSGVRMAQFGELSLYAKQYVVAVVDGEAGSELYGLFRLNYDVPIYRAFGVGFAPTWVYRFGNYENEPDVESDSFEWQAYVSWQL